MQIMRSMGLMGGCVRFIGREHSTPDGACIPLSGGSWRFRSGSRSVRAAREDVEDERHQSVL
jgi:hypothetical protein